MKMKNCLLKMMLLSCMVLTTFASMAQGSFAYQAVIRDAQGKLVADKQVGMQFTLSYNSNVYYQETHKTTTNAYGNVSVMVGSGTIVKGSFMSVPWNTMQIMMNVEVSVDNNSEYVSLGSIQIQPVPYALYAESFNRVVSPAADADADSPLFSVKNSAGDVVFAVYQNAVEIYVDEEPASKTMKHGFAVSGLKATKDGEAETIFSVNSDGTQVFIDDDPSKTMKHGFAVSGLKATKDGEDGTLFSVNSDGTQVFVDEDPGKTMKHGFAVSGLKATKDGEAETLFSVNSDGTQVFIDDDPSKTMKHGFAVSGLKATKDGGSEEYFAVNVDSVSIATSSFNVSDKKSGNEVFAVSNNTAKFHADILTTGGIGNVVENADCDYVYDKIIDKDSMNADGDFLCYELSYSGSITIGDKTIAFTPYPSVYGIAESGDLVEANDGEVPFLYFDDYGRLTQKESENFIAAVIDGNDGINVGFEFCLKNISDATKFCLIGETVEGDKYETFRINYSFSSKNAEPVSDKPVQEGKYGPVYAKYNIKDGEVEHEFEYVYMNGTECLIYDREGYLVLILNAGNYKTSSYFVKDGEGGYNLAGNEDIAKIKELKFDPMANVQVSSKEPLYSLNNVLALSGLSTQGLNGTGTSDDGIVKFELRNGDEVMFNIETKNDYIYKLSSVEGEVIIECAGMYSSDMALEILSGLNIGDSMIGK